MKCGGPFCYFVERLGPYHVARLNEIARTATITALELHPDAQTYAWAAPTETLLFDVVQLSTFDEKALGVALEKIRPAVNFLNGWSDHGALWGLRWCLAHDVPAVVMSDSQFEDAPRTFWRETLKRWIVKACGAAFVAGQRHASYIRRLGMTGDNIVLGYDVIDNDYFRTRADQAKQSSKKWREDLGLPQDDFFLCVARLVPKKNLTGLLHAFAWYRERVSARGMDGAWPLVLIGNGPHRDLIEREIISLRLTGAVYLLDFQQYNTLPACYGLAGAFVLASTTEQWGLVVNEAMAAGLPVIVSTHCGCVPELVHEGVNGFAFDPNDTENLADLMFRVATTEQQVRQAWGDAGRRIIAEWSLERFAAGLTKAAQIAKRNRSRNLARRLITGWLLRSVSGFKA